MAPAILYDPFFLEHDTGRHPETAARLITIVDLLRERGLWKRLAHHDPLVAGEHQGIGGAEIDGQVFRKVA